MFLHLILTLASGLLLVPPPPIIFPTGEEVDVPAIADVVIDVDPDDLLDALDAPFPDDALPEAFLNPPRGEETILEEADLTSPFTAEGFPGGVGDVSFAFDTNPDLVDGILTGGQVSYVVTDHDLSRAEIRALHAVMEEELANQADAELPEGVDRYDTSSDLEQFGGVEAVSASIAMEGTGMNLVFSFLFVPVGNTLVVTNVIISMFSDVAVPTVRALTDELAAAAIQHLGDVAESAA
jgi:hypothetical protein